jgi:hypothetical protein
MRPASRDYAALDGLDLRRKSTRGSASRFAAAGTEGRFRGQLLAAGDAILGGLDALFRGVIRVGAVVDRCRGLLR